MVFVPTSRPISHHRHYLFSVTLLVALPLKSCSFVTQSSSSLLPRRIEAVAVGNNDGGGASSPLRRWRRAFRRKDQSSSSQSSQSQRPRKDSVFGLSRTEDKVTMKGRTAMSGSAVLEQETSVMDNILLNDYELLDPSDVLPNLTFDEISLPYVMGPQDELLLNHIKDYAANDDDENDFHLESGLRSEMLLPLNHQQDSSAAIPNTFLDKQPHRAAVLHKMVKSYLEGVLENLFHRWSVETPGSLSVQVQPEQLSQLFRGKLKADAKVTFSNLKTAPLSLSSGSIEAKRLTLNVLSFIGMNNNNNNHASDNNNNNQNNKLRYPSQFDFHFNDFCFTGQDLMQSRSIRNGLQRLLKRILERAGLVAYNQVTVTSIRILPNGKIACSGEAGTPISGQMIPFEVRSGIGLSSRGHVVTFPGLEVSLQPALGVFMPVYPELDLDMGHNARLLSVDINGFLKTLSFSAKATVTPEHTLKLNKYMQTKESLGAQYNFDVGQWLTKIGNFTR